MKMPVDGFEFDFNFHVGEKVFKFDEGDKTKNTYHGLSHAMKAVDLILESEDCYYFIEIKDASRSFHDYSKDDKPFNSLLGTLKYKYRDTYLYRLAEGKTDKPIRYICLLTFKDNAQILKMNDDINRQLPVGTPISRWKKEIAGSAVVVNVKLWNDNFPNWKVNYVQPIP